MKYNKLKYKQELKSNSLIGSSQNRALLEFQRELGIALRGGSLPMTSNRLSASRLTKDVNLMNSSEKKELIFSGTVYYN